MASAFRQILIEKDKLLPLSIPVLCTGGLWIFHYWFDFLVASNVGANNSFIIWHIMPLALGGLIYVRLRQKSPFKVAGLSTIFTLTLMGISTIVVDRTLAQILLVIIGSSAMIGASSILVLVTDLLDRVEIRGTLYSSVHVVVAVLLALAVLLSIWFAYGGLLFYLAIVVAVGYALLRSNKDVVNYPARESIGIRHLAGDREYIPVYIAALFQGFFYSSIYYAIVDYLEVRTAIESMRVLLIVELSVVMIIIAVPLGILLDRVGRKVIVLAGLYLQGIALFLIALMPDALITFNLVITIIIPILAIGVIGGIFIAFLLFVELAPEFGKRGFVGLFMTASGTGMSLGLIVTNSLQELTASSPMAFPITLLLIYFTLTLVIAQLREPLPSKSEREWKKKIHDLIIISSGGLPIFHHQFQQGAIQVDSSLASGALTGIEGILSEITRERGFVKIIKQEDFCIMLEHGKSVTLALLADEELPILRKMMQIFLEEFQAFFGELIEMWEGDVIVFSPTERIIQKVFGI